VVGVHPAIAAIAATPIIRPANIMARERMSISLLPADASTTRRARPGVMGKPLLYPRKGPSDPGLAGSVISDVVTRVTQIEMRQDIQRRLPPAS
jgi:hypothetical protein